MLGVLENHNLTNVCVVVTRYFGGIKLGTGGLARVYAHAAAQGLAASTLAELQTLRRVAVTVAYPLFSPLENWLQKNEIRVADKSYAENVTLTLYLSPDATETVKKAVADLTAGQACLKDQGEIETLVPLSPA